MTTKIHPLISVCIPNYNYARFLNKSIQCVLNQTYPHFELIIVDDNSTDDSVEIIKKYAQKDKRIRYYVNKKNRGMVNNYNKTLLLSKCEYVMLLAADDYYAPTILEKYALFIQKNPTTEYLFCDEAIVNCEEKLLYKKKREPKRIKHYNGKLVPPKIMKELLLYKPTHPLPLTGSLIKKKVFIKYLYNQNHQFCPDWHLDTKIAINNHIFGYIHEVLAYCRIHGKNYGKITFEKTNREYLEKFKIFEEFFPNTQINNLRLKRIKRNWFYSYVYITLYSMVKFPRSDNLKHIEILSKLHHSFFEKSLLIIMFILWIYDSPKIILSLIYKKIYRNIMSLFFDKEMIA